MGYEYWPSRLRKLKDRRKSSSGLDAGRIAVQFRGVAGTLNGVGLVNLGQISVRAETVVPQKKMLL